MSRIKNSYKTLIREFELQKQRIVNGSSNGLISESGVEKKKNIEQSKKNYKFFFERYFSHYAKTRCSQYQLRWAKRIKRNKNFRGVHECYRGGGKSVHHNIGIPLWLWINGNLTNMLLVSYSKEASLKLLLDIQAEFEVNPQIIEDFGEMKSSSDWAKGNFTLTDGTHFHAAGAGQNVRGLRRGANRPDYIVIDDVDTDEMQRNSSRLDNLENWLYEAVLRTMEMGRGRFVIIGNRIGKESIVARFSENPHFFHEKINVYENGTKIPTWKENYTTEEIDQEIETMGSIRAQKEFFNNPMIKGKIFQSEWFAYKNLPKLHKYEEQIIYIDPSFKDTKTSDYVSIQHWGRIGKEYHLIKVFSRHRSGLYKWMEWLYNYYDELPEKIQRILRIYTEAGFLQGDIVNDAVDTIGDKRGWYLDILPDKRKKEHKEERITKISGKYENGQVFLNIKEKHDPGMKVFVNQHLAFAAGSSFPVDNPDCAEGALFILSRGMRRVKSKPPIFTKRKSQRW